MASTTFGFLNCKLPKTAHATGQKSRQLSCNAVAAPPAPAQAASTLQKSKSLSQTLKTKNLVLDLGGVLMQWNGRDSEEIRAQIHPKLLTHMLQDVIWNEYETGKITKQEAYNKLSHKFNVPAESIQRASEIARQNLCPVPEIHRIVDECRGKVRVFCMSNIPADEWEAIYGKDPTFWQNFERVFTSADAGMRKPDLDFFRHVLKETGINPTETVFVDDCLMNYTAAKSLGMTAVWCANVNCAVKELAFYLRSEDDRLAAGRAYFDRVYKHDRHELITITNKGSTLTDNCAEFICAELLRDPRFLPMACAPENGEICYTRDRNMKEWILFDLPTDLDSTSIGLSALHALDRVDLQFIRGVVDKMTKYVNAEGIFQTYFDHSRLRVDPVVICNITYIFHLVGRAPPAGSMQFLYNVLLNKAYMQGSEYYIHPTSFLYFLSRTAAKFRNNHFLPADFIPLLTTRVRETMATETNHLCVALVILACLNLQIEPDSRDVERLARAQNPDGSWDMEFIAKGNVLLFGNKPLTAAFALNALERVRDLRIQNAH